MTRTHALFFPPLTPHAFESQLPSLREKLTASGTLVVEPNEHGVYAASESQNPDSLSGYQNAWLRDNVMIAFSKWTCGDPQSAFKTLRGLMTFLQTQAKKMEAIIQQPQLKEEVNRRPHVRFEAHTLSEIDQGWAHAQNDALGYLFWLRFRLANEEDFSLTPAERELCGVLTRYFEAIQYWKDLDSGAWEEARKLNSSSVGAVLAGLVEAAKYLHDGNVLPGITEEYLAGLISMGKRTLDEQLPFEAPPQRRSDAALLFLIYPLEVVTNEQTKRMILSFVRARLLGPFGIRRYIGDSYYCQDYDLWFPPAARSADFSDRIDLRDEFLQPGCEAQWCLFDPLLSTIYATQYLRRTTHEELLHLQLEHLNRSIAQISERAQCPELYYFKNGRPVTNEHTPLAWTQANLSIALRHLEMVGQHRASAGGRSSRR
jgi:hypothetical protein